MNKIIKIFTLLALVFSLSSCELDKYPENEIPLNDAIEDLDDVKQAIFGVYSAFKNDNLYSGSLTLAPDIQADLAYAVQGYTNAYGEVYRWEMKASSSYAEGVYSGLYTIISRSNWLLDNAAKVEATLVSKEDKETMSKCVGDAYFARALAYSELIKVYCGAYISDESAKEALGISITTHYDPEQKTPLRSSLYDSYQQVIADLEIAEENLAIRDGSDSPYFTIGAVHSLYARVYLNMEKWELAEKHATEVIDNKNYKLSNATVAVTAEGQTDYDLMWTYDSSSEIIWKVMFNANDYGGSLSTLFLKYNFVTYTPDYVPTSQLVNMFEPSDLRYRAFFRETQTGYPHGLTTEMLVKYYSNPNIDGGGIPLFRNTPKVFRLSEQYLIRAEARYNLGNISEGCEDISTLRRARFQNFGVFSGDDVALIEAVKNERKIELCFEGFRLNDLKRWGEGFTRLAQNQSIEGPDRMKIESSHPLFVWPIPQHELDAVPGMQPNPSNNL